MFLLCLQTLLKTFLIRRRIQRDIVITIMCFQQMHTFCYIKYLQFLPTCFGPKDHYQGNVYNEHRDIVTEYTYMVCGCIKSSVRVQGLRR